MTVKLHPRRQKNKQLLKRTGIAIIVVLKNKQLLKRTGIAIIVVLTVFALSVLIFYWPQLVLSYLQVLVWPCVVIIALIRYRRFIESLASRSKLTFNLGGVSIETTLERLERSIGDNLRGRKLSKDQLEWLKLLRDEGRIKYVHDRDYERLYPLRNAGLLWAYPEGFLTQASEVGISPLGELLLEAWERNQKSH